MPAGRRAAKAAPSALRRCAGGGMRASSCSRGLTSPTPCGAAAPSSNWSWRPSGRCGRGAAPPPLPVPLAPLWPAPLAAAASAAFSAISWRMRRARGDSSTMAVSAVDGADIRRAGERASASLVPPGEAAAARALSALIANPPRVAAPAVSPASARKVRASRATAMAPSAPSASSSVRSAAAHALPAATSAPGGCARTRAAPSRAPLRCGAECSRHRLRLQWRLPGSSQDARHCLRRHMPVVGVCQHACRREYAGSTQCRLVAASVARQQPALLKLVVLLLLRSLLVGGLVGIRC
eukprot:3572623-Pleurochrysis_carterae.AAC.1